MCSSDKECTLTATEKLVGSLQTVANHSSGAPIIVARILNARLDQPTLNRTSEFQHTFMQHHCEVVSHSVVPTFVNLAGSFVIDIFAMIASRDIIKFVGER